MNAKRMLLLATPLLVLFALLSHIGAKAQTGGPNFTTTFSPPNNANVTDTVTIHIEWVCNPNCGSAKVTVSCGGGDQIENTTGRFDFHWDTHGCSNGSQTVEICTRTTQDEQWQSANCETFAYNLTGSPPPSQPTESFWADATSIQSGQCTVMHWQTTNATAVNIDGQNVDTSGFAQICPMVTTKYSIDASNSSGHAYGNFTVQVSTVAPPHNNPTPIPVGGGNGNGSNPTAVPPPVNPPPPNCNGVLPPHLVVGQNAVVTQAGDNLHLRAGDGVNQPQRGKLHTGDVVLVIGGPRCTDGYNWWQVQTANQGTWWAVEADGSSYWLDLMNGPQPPPSNGGDNPSPNTDCSPAPSRLNAGDQAVVSDFDPNPLLVYNSQDIRSGIKFKVPVREVVSIISATAVCAWNVTWVEVGYQGQDGWAIEANAKGSYNLIPNGMPLPGPGGNGQPTSIPATAVPPTPIPPTQTPQPAAPAPQAQAPNDGTGIQCTGSALNTDSGVEAVMYSKDQDMQVSCVDYIRENNRDHGLIACLIAHGWKTNLNTGAAEIVNAVTQYDGKDCGVVSMYQGNQLGNLSNLPNDYFLVVWGPNCGETHTAGHIAVFQSYADNSIKVDDANYPPGSPGGTHVHPLPDKDKACVTFIQMSGSPLSPASNSSSGQTGNGGQTSTPPTFTNGNFVHTTATSVTWSFCVACTSEAWIEFHLPTNLSAYGLNFKGNGVSVEDIAVTADGSNTVVKCHVSAATIQTLIDQGYGGELGKPENWNLWYLPAS